MRTLQKIGVIGSSALLLIGANVALAEDTSQPVPRPPVKAAVEARRAVRTDLKKEVQDARGAAKTQIKDVREEAKNKIADMRDKAKQKLGEIKDKAKQELATKLASQFDNINKTSTDHFTLVLNQLDAIVTKVEARAAAGNGTASTTAAIASARAAIATARTAVQAQAAKTYVVDPATVTTTSATTSEKGQGQLIKALRDAYSTLHKQLTKDLAAVRDGVMKDARKAVSDVVGTVSRAPRGEDHNATSTDNKEGNNNNNN